MRITLAHKEERMDFEPNEWGQCQAAAADDSRRCRKSSEWLVEFDDGTEVEFCQFHAVIYRDRGLVTMKRAF